MTSERRHLRRLCRWLGATPARVAALMVLLWFAFALAFMTWALQLDEGYRGAPIIFHPHQ